MKLSDKRYITVLVLILCLCGLTACREKSTGETEDDAGNGRVRMIAKRWKAPRGFLFYSTKKPPNTEI